MSEPPIILIAGPTGSGKSALALGLAQALGGTVINADSMQVYAELRLLTARPTPVDEALAPHRLYGHCPASEAYSAGRFAAEAKAEISAAKTAGRIPIIVGGTGLYFKALVEGFPEIPPVPDNVRNRWRERAAAEGSRSMHAELSGSDPQLAARLKPSDTQRIVRALEVLEATGRSLSYWQALPSVPVFDSDKAAKFVIEIDRAELRARCDRRLDLMLEAGALDEVRNLLALGIAADRPAMRAVGVPEFTAVIRGEAAVDEALERAKIATRQYIKRQHTWLRRNMITWKYIFSQQIEYMQREVIAFIDSQH